MKKNNKDKIKELLGKLNSLEQSSFPVSETNSLVDDIINKEYYDTTSKIKESSTIKFLDAIDKKLNKFQRDFDLKPVSESISDFQKELELIKQEMSDEFSTIKDSVEGRMNEIDITIKKLEKDLGITTTNKTSPIIKSLTDLQVDFKLNLDENKQKEETLSKVIEELQDSLKSLSGRITRTGKSNEDLINSSVENLTKIVTDVEGKLSSLKKELLDRISSNVGGGSPNQQINVKSSVMSLKFSDINFANSTSIGWTATDDNTNKRVNISASVLLGGGSGTALTVKEVDGAPSVSNVSVIRVSNGTLTDDGGGQVTVSTGGGGSGITRVSSIISVSSTFGATAQTDYVAYANVGIALTLPTAVGNDNLYTIKNVSNSSVLIGVTGVETIDGDSNTILADQYTSVDLRSDGTNWNIT